MKILELAEEYTDTTLFNVHTQKHVLIVTELFVSRSGAKYLNEITLNSLVRFKKKTLALAKPVTFNGYIKYLRLIGKYAVEKGYLSENPFYWIQTAPLGEIPKKILSSTEIQKTINYLEDPENTEGGWFWSILVKCLYYTGMRRRQIVNLKLSDLDFDGETIRLSYSGSKTLKEWCIPMHNSLKENLIVLIEQTEAVRKKKLRQNDYIFRAFDLFPRFKADEQGRMAPEAITGYFKRLNLKHNLRIGSHRFRHTLATQLCNPCDNTPPDLFAVQQLLGHNNINTTRGYVQTELHRLKTMVGTIKVLESEDTGN